MFYRYVVLLSKICFTFSEKYISEGHVLFTPLRVSGRGPNPFEGEYGKPGGSILFSGTPNPVVYPFTVGGKNTISPRKFSTRIYQMKRKDFPLLFTSTFVLFLCQRSKIIKSKKKIKITMD